MSANTHYRVVWEIDVFSAKSPLDAATFALEVMRDEESIALVFNVTDTTSGSSYTVDLLDPESPVVTIPRNPSIEPEP